MKVLIYGGGSVGLGIASCLIKANTSVDILARDDTVLPLQTNGLTRSGIFGPFHAEPARFRSCSSLKKIPDIAFDYILVCVKSFDSSAAARDLSQEKRLFNEKTKIVLFQNGWSNAEKFLPFFDTDRIYSARVITGFTRPQKNCVHITVHADSIHIGSLFGSSLSPVEKLCELLTRGDIPTQTTPYIEKDLWAKMLYNCALNSIGAVLDVPYGQLAASDFSKTIMNGIVEEIFEVLTAAGYQTHWNSANDFLEVFYKKLIPDTAEHKSSTLQDILAKRKTEIDALNGAVTKLADEFHVDVPYNLLVYNLVKFIEARSS